MKSKKISSSAIFPNCRVILHSLQCNSAHLYQRLHWDKIKYPFHRSYGEGRGLKAWPSLLSKTKEKHKLKIATRVTTLHLKTSISEAQSTKLIQQVSQACNVTYFVWPSSLKKPVTVQSFRQSHPLHPQTIGIKVSPTCNTILHFIQNLHRPNMYVCGKKHHQAAHHHNHRVPHHQFFHIHHILSNCYLCITTDVHSLFFGTTFFPLYS